MRVEQLAMTRSTDPSSRCQRLVEFGTPDPLHLLADRNDRGYRLQTGQPAPEAVDLAFDDRLGTDALALALVGILRRRLRIRSSMSYRVDVVEVVDRAGSKFRGTARSDEEHRPLPPCPQKVLHEGLRDDVVGRGQPSR